MFMHACIYKRMLRIHTWIYLQTCKMIDTTMQNLVFAGAQDKCKARVFLSAAKVTVRVSLQGCTDVCAMCVLGVDVCAMCVLGDGVCAMCVLGNGVCAMCVLGNGVLGDGMCVVYVLGDGGCACSLSPLVPAISFLALEAKCKCEGMRERLVRAKSE